MGPNATLEPSSLCWKHTCCYANGTGLCFSDYLKFSSTNEAGLLHHVAFWKGWWLLSIYTSSSCTWPLSWWEHAFAFYKVVTFAWKTSWDSIRIYNNQINSGLHKGKDVLAIFQKCPSPHTPPLTVPSLFPQPQEGKRRTIQHHSQKVCLGFYFSSKLNWVLLCRKMTANKDKARESGRGRTEEPWVWEVHHLLRRVLK